MATVEVPEADAELRLALVCYGGVSLAIYMHGVSKELHKLVVASRRFEECGDVDTDVAFPPGKQGVDTERVYFEALRELARQGRRLRVEIDIVAGTSAGGINGVCLAKVLARNGSQDRLKRLWIDEGDLRTLLRAPDVGSWKLQSVLAALPILLRPASPGSPLRGERMSRLLFDAIDAMEEQQGDARSLLRPGRTLDLYVTTTDLHGFEALIPTGAGGVSQRDRNHAQVLKFSAGPDGGDFAGDATGALAFAARATSCFPGAFAPVNVERFARELAGRRAGARHRIRTEVSDHFQYNYYENGRSAAQAWFVDGGVLDNAPFDLAIRAIGEKPAQTEVVRRLVYIEPDPGHALDAPVGDGPAGGAGRSPGWLPSLWQAVSTVKGSHSLIRELLTLRDMNTRIGEVAAIADQQMAQVNSILQARWEELRDGPSQVSQAEAWQAADRADVAALSDAMHREAVQRTGLAHRGYCLLKAEDASRRLAAEVAQCFQYPPDAGRSSFVRSAMAAWLRARQEWCAPDPQALSAYFRPLDIPYRERRLLFIIAGINRLYASPQLSSAVSGMTRASLNALKAEAWELLEQLRRVPGQVVAGLGGLTDFLDDAALDPATVVTTPETFASDHADEFAALFQAYGDRLREQLGDGSSVLWESFAARTAEWGGQAADERNALLSRYLGFPLWDALIFPTVALSRLPQYSPIRVSQFSPSAARAVPPPPREVDGPARKLKGVSLHHFGGFTDRAWRENDYLWGRLDAVELVLRTLRSTTSPGCDQTLPANREQAAELAGRAHLVAGLRAVIAAERDLSGARDTLEHVARCADEIADTQDAAGADDITADIASARDTANADRVMARTGDRG